MASALRSRCFSCSSRLCLSVEGTVTSLLFHSGYLVSICLEGRLCLFELSSDSLDPASSTSLHPSLPWGIASDLGSLTCVAADQNVIVAVAAEGLCHIFDLSNLEGSQSFRPQRSVRVPLNANRVLVQEQTVLIATSSSCLFSVDLASDPVDVQLLVGSMPSPIVSMVMQSEDSLIVGMTNGAAIVSGVNSKACSLHNLATGERIHIHVPGMRSSLSSEELAKASSSAAKQFHQQTTATTTLDHDMFNVSVDWLDQEKSNIALCSSTGRIHLVNAAAAGAASIPLWRCELRGRPIGLLTIPFDDEDNNTIDDSPRDNRRILVCMGSGACYIVDDEHHVYQFELGQRVRAMSAGRVRTTSKESPPDEQTMLAFATFEDTVIVCSDWLISRSEPVDFISSLQSSGELASIVQRMHALGLLPSGSVDELDRSAWTKAVQTLLDEGEENVE